MSILNQNFAFVFPGQGSQKVGMGKALVEEFPVAKDVFMRADDILGYSLSKLAWEGPEDELNDTVNTQPALFVHSVAALATFKDIFTDKSPAMIAGHSLGELSALVASEALSFEHGLKLVHNRGKLMKQAGEVSPGGMAAILGLTIPEVEKVCEEASSGEDIVQIANDNCPGQVVISGAGPAVERALPLAKDLGAKRAIPLAVSVAAHSYLMAQAQSAFKEVVMASSLSFPKVPIIGNVSALPLGDIPAIEADLEAQLTSRVRWTDTIEYIIKNGTSTFIEIGTGKILTGLIRRIDRDASRSTLGTPEDFQNLQS
ncbi:MAG: ACP S-malonyltransferase [Chloroflexota bacterium]